MDNANQRIRESAFRTGGMKTKRITYMNYLSGSVMSVLPFFLSLSRGQNVFVLCSMCSPTGVEKKNPSDLELSVLYVYIFYCLIYILRNCLMRLLSVHLTGWGIKLMVV